METSCLKLLEYQPEIWAVKKDDIYAAKSALTDGIAYAKELLSNHDRDLGRAHRSNKIAAEHMEQAIKDMENVLARLCRYSANQMPPDFLDSNSETAQNNVQ
jgi:hypothetical protein